MADSQRRRQSDEPLREKQVHVAAREREQAVHGQDLVDDSFRQPRQAERAGEDLDKRQHQRNRRQRPQLRPAGAQRRSCWEELSSAGSERPAGFGRAEAAKRRICCTVTNSKHFAFGLEFQEYSHDR
ncbi:hypothetical protein KL919_003658 [Ogataea angusta]|nr:hypothetical protein KL919_003658 [Ogataea angusta]